MISALKILKQKGAIVVTAVNSDLYRNMFRFDEVVEELGIRLSAQYRFDPKDYPEYEHTMTHQEESGIAHYSQFITYEFYK